MLLQHLDFLGQPIELGECGNDLRIIFECRAGSKLGVDHKGFLQTLWEANFDCIILLGNNDASAILLVSHLDIKERDAAVLVQFNVLNLDLGFKFCNLFLGFRLFLQAQLLSSVSLGTLLLRDECDALVEIVSAGTINNIEG